MSVIGRMYVTIGPDGEPRRVYSTRERADWAARAGALSVQVVMPEYQHQGAVELEDALLSYFGGALPGPGVPEVVNAAVARALTRARGQ